MVNDADIVSKPSSEQYRNNFDDVFNKGGSNQDKEEIVETVFVCLNCLREEARKLNITDPVCTVCGGRCKIKD